MKDRSLNILWGAFSCLAICAGFTFFTMNNIIKDMQGLRKDVRHNQESIRHLTRIPTIHVESAVITPDVGELVVEEIEISS